MAHLRRHSVSRRTVVRGAVGAAAGSLLLGSSARLVWPGRGVGPGRHRDVAGGFLVNGRHLSFGDDPTHGDVGRRAAVQHHHYNAVPPRSVRVWVDYGRDRSYGHTVEAEIRELLTHVPVWDGQPGVLRASRTLNADQFFVHAHLTHLHPGTQYHYRFRYAAGREIGTTADATFLTAPRGGWPSRSRSPRLLTRASPGRPWTATPRCCPSRTGGVEQRLLRHQRPGPPGPHAPGHHQRR